VGALVNASVILAFYLLEVFIGTFFMTTDMNFWLAVHWMEPGL
jgi:hypothetical protein